MANRFYLIESGKVVLESGEEFGEPWWWWERLARAICSGGPGCSRPTFGILQRVQSNRLKPFSFMATILREYCEMNHSLGYELFKRIAPVMLRRLQAARKKMLSIHAHGEKLSPSVGLSPFMHRNWTRIRTVMLMIRVISRRVD